ncbi:hypothetical protein Fmac_021015 [Flemingia macrophylla]|uniref:Uncharacterized protein n=1 Tax=Flemingia macrophylla TaxID=520843 RepID=A0ABD1LW61_9FABA
MATDTSAETIKLERKLDALLNLVTQLAANQKAASFSALNDAIVIIRVHDLATDTSAETRKLEDKLDAIVNLVTQAATNQKPASIARVCGIRYSNDHQTNVNARNDAIVIRGVHDVATDTSAETRKLEGKLDALLHLVTQLAANQKAASIARQFSVRNDAIVIRGVHDVATDTSVETRKLEGKLHSLVNLVIQLAANQKPASVARVCGIRSSSGHHTSQFNARNDAIVIRGVHDVATDTSAETRKLEGKLDALVNLVTQLAANQKPASVARQFSARNDAIVIRVVHDVATDTSAETRKLEGKLDALVNLVTQLAANQKPVSIARVCDIRSSNDHHTSVCPSSQQSRVDGHPEAYAANTYSRPPQQ